MPQSLAGVYVHLVFSTRHRAPLILEDIRGELHSYVASIIKQHGSTPILVNSVEDHIHILLLLGRQSALSDLVQKMKIGSSAWVKRRDARCEAFSWQGGYAAFSVGARESETVRRYIANQREHHRERTFQDELRELLTLGNVSFDETYLWD